MQQTTKDAILGRGEGEQVNSQCNGTATKASMEGVDKFQVATFEHQLPVAYNTSLCSTPIHENALAARSAHGK